MLVIFVALSLLALAPAGAEDFIEPSINCAPERLRDDRFQGQDPGCDPRQGSNKGLLANWGAVGGNGGGVVLKWRQCLEGTFVNQVCLGKPVTESDIPSYRRSGILNNLALLMNVKLRWTDGVELIVGPGSTSSPAAFYMDCIDIDVDNGEKVSQFYLSYATDRGGSTGVANFYLKTRKTSGAEQELKHEVSNNDARLHDFSQNIPALDIGSGLICGYWARTGAIIDAFALLFLSKINNPTIVNAATVVEAQSSGFDASQTSFGGYFLCPKANQTEVCTNSFSYQYGETATATTSNTKSWSESSTQELTIGVKMKDAFEHSVTVGQKQDKSGSLTSTKTYTTNKMTTVTLGLPCNCPTYIQPNTFCNFSFTYQSSAIFNSLEWSGQMVYQLANGEAKIMFPVNGIIGGTILSQSIKSLPAVCGVGPPGPTPSPSAEFSGCYFFANYSATPYDPISRVPLNTMTNPTAEGCRTLCVDDEFCTDYRFCDSTTLLKTCRNTPSIPINTGPAGSGTPTRKLLRTDALLGYGISESSSNASDLDRVSDGDVMQEIGEDQGSLRTTSGEHDVDDDSEETHRIRALLAKNKKRAQVSKRKPKHKRKPKPYLRTPQGNPFPSLGNVKLQLGTIHMPQGDPTCNEYEGKYGVSCRPDERIVAPLFYMGKQQGTESWYWQKCMQGYSVKTIDIFDEYTYNKGTDPQDMPWVGMRQIEITYNDADSTMVRFGNGCNCGGCDCIKTTITLDTDELITSLSMAIGSATFERESSYLKTLKIRTLKSGSGQTQELKNPAYINYKSDYLTVAPFTAYGREFNVDVGSGLLCGFHSWYDDSSDGRLIFRLAPIFLRKVGNSVFQTPVLQLTSQSAKSGTTAPIDVGAACNVPGAPKVCTDSIAYSYGATSTSTVTATTALARTGTSSISMKFEALAGIGGFAQLKLSFSSMNSDSDSTTTTNTQNTVQSYTAAAPCNCPTNVPADILCQFHFDFIQTISWAEMDWVSEVWMYLDSGFHINLPVYGKAKGTFQQVQITEAPVLCSIPPPGSPSPPPPPYNNSWVCTLYNENRAVIEKIDGNINVRSYCACYQSCQSNGDCEGFKYCGQEDLPKYCLIRKITSVDGLTNLSPEAEARCNVPQLGALRS